MEGGGGRGKKGAWSLRLLVHVTSERELPKIPSLLVCRTNKENAHNSLIVDCAFVSAKKKKKKKKGGENLISRTLAPMGLEIFENTSSTLTDIRVMKGPYCADTSSSSFTSNQPY
jgi:hypothetical protein